MNHKFTKTTTLIDRLENAKAELVRNGAEEGTLASADLLNKWDNLNKVMLEIKNMQEEVQEEQRLREEIQSLYNKMDQMTAKADVLSDYITDTLPALEKAVNRAVAECTSKGAFTKAELVDYLTDMRVQVLSVRMSGTMPKATIAWQDYGKIKDDPRKNVDYCIAMR